MNNDMIPFEECPVGMFTYDGELCLKTEYGLEAYIVSSGERFWGGVNNKEQLRHVMVCPVEVEPVRRGEWLAISCDPDDPYFNCSECMCGFSTIYHEGEEMKHCPECGAKMDE